MHNRQLLRSKKEAKQHYKMYKTGRGWWFASITVLSFGAMTLMNQETGQAATSNTSTDTTAVSTAESNQDSLTGQSVVLSKSTDEDTSTTDTSEDSIVTKDTSVSNAPVAIQNNQQEQENTMSAKVDSSQVATGNNEALGDATDQAAKSPSGSQVSDQKEPTQKTVSVNTNLRMRSMRAMTTVAANGITLSADKIGYGSDGNGITIKFNFSGVTGDTFSIIMPANTAAYSLGTIPQMPNSMGTTTTSKDVNGNTVIQNKLTATASYEQVLHLNQLNNYNSQQTPMAEIGTVTKQIVAQKNGDEIAKATFTQTITPNANLVTPTRLHPSGAVITALSPSTDYVYQIAVNESTGVLNDDYASNRVNSAANYGGTTITIPVPTSFELNQNLSTRLNEFSAVSGQTITQAGVGADVIIYIPATQGSQNYQGLPAYQIAGHYNLTETDKPQVVTANAPAMMTQIIGDNGQTLNSTSKEVWTENILSVDDTTPTGAAKPIVAGNDTITPEKLLLDDDASNDPTVVNSMTFNTSTANSLTDAKITISVPDGLNATGIKVPDGGSDMHTYLEGTTSYAYTMTLADGSVEKGTVKAGGTIAPANGSAIRQIILEPNFLAAGASTGTMTNQKITVYGNLAHYYDNGDAVQDGDQLKTTMTISTVKGNIVSVNGDVTQTVIFPEDTVAKATGYVKQTSGQAGDQQAGTISLSMTGNSGQTANSIYEPIYYFVLPSATNPVSVTDVPDGGVVSQFLADDGRIVVKVDYSDSGKSISTQQTGLIKINLANNSDALPGNYPINMYVTSPRTKLQNTESVTDLSLTDGDAAAVVVPEIYGNNTWKITSVSAAYGATMAQGNRDVVPVKAGESYRDGDETLTFYDTLVNTNTNPAINMISYLNLPTVGDASGSQYNFNLTKAVTIPTAYLTTAGEVPLKADQSISVLYSTKLQDLNSEPDAADFVTASQIANWSTVRSIMIKVSSLPSATSTGRIEITGTSEDGFKNTGDETGYLETGFIADSYPYGHQTKDEESSIVLKDSIVPTVKLNSASFDYNGTKKASQADGLQVVVTIPNNPTPFAIDLTSDYIMVTNDGVNANTYSYTLSEKGIQKVKDALSSYDVDPSQVKGEITINKAKATITVNDAKFDYDGASHSIPDTNVTVSGVVNGEKLDYTLTNNARAATGSQMVSVALTDGSSVNANYDITATDTATLTINPTKVSSVDLSSVSFKYDGITKASDAIGLTAIVTLPNGQTRVVNLDRSQITVDGDGVKADHYSYKLNAEGVQAVQTVIGDYQLSNDKIGIGGIDILAADVTVTLNDDSFAYNGITKASDATDLTATITIPGQGTKALYLTSEDIVIADDGTAVGNYTYTLSAMGIAKLQKVSGNDVKVVADGISGTITILPVAVDPGNPETPTEPENPIIPETPEVPETPAEPGVPTTPETPVKPTRPETPTTGQNLTSTTPVATETTPHQVKTGQTAKANDKNQQAPEKLPQTDESQQSATTILGLSLMGLLTALGFKRKKKENE